MSHFSAGFARASARPGLALAIARDVLDLVGHPVFPRAPAGTFRTAARQERLDLRELAVLEPEEFEDFPGPGLRGTGVDGPAVGGREVAGVAGGVVEERERDDDAALLIDGDVAAVADAGDEVQEARLELFLAAPLAGVACSGFRVGASLAGGSGRFVECCPFSIRLQSSVKG